MNDDIDDHTPTPGPSHSDVVVVGAGIAGLSAAVTVASSGAAVTVLDAHPGGGRARTDQRDGFLHNTGPHALYVGGHLHDLLRRHGLELSGGAPDTTRLQLWWRGEVARLDLDPVGLLRTRVFGLRSKVRMMTLLGLVPRRRPASFVGRSVDEWLGDEPADVADFVRAMVRLATYGHAPSVLDAGAAVAQLQIAFRGVRYLDHGWGNIVDGLLARTRDLGALVSTDTAVDAIERDGDRFVVHTAGGAIRAASVVIATGGPEIAERLTGERVEGRERLTAPVTAASLDLALDRIHEGIQLGIDEPLYLSPHAPLAALAPAGCGLVSVLRYSGPDEDPGDPRLRKEQLRSFARLAGIAPTEVLHERYLHRSIVSHGLPTGTGGGLVGRPTIDALGVPGLVLAGDWVGPTGFIADAAAASGEAAGRRAAAVATHARISA